MKAVIVDIDGICFDPTERLARCKNDNSTIDWNRAFSNEEIILDPVINGAPEAIDRIFSLNNVEIVFITGRSEKCRKVTEWSLDYNDMFNYADLFMRQENDFRHDHEIKAEIIKAYRIIYFKNEIIAAIDDDYNGKLKPMYESLGIPCFLSFEDFFGSEVWKE